MALWRARAAVERHLAAGGALVCEDGWFTAWIPGNRWVHSNDKPTRDVRYRVVNDRFGLFDGIDRDAFAFTTDRVAGWWSCGYIEPSASADVILVDTWDRPVVVLDGRMLLTASGPLVLPWVPAAVTEVWQRARRLLAGEALQPSASALLPAPRVARASPQARIGLLFNGVWSQWAFATAPKYRDIYRLIYTHDLSERDLHGLDALVVPFQSHASSLRTHRPLIDAFIKNGGTALFCGEPHLDWLGAHWESRPVDNTWWNRLPVEPPIPVTDRTHALYASLTDRHSGWHHHGVFTQTPSGARIIQRSKLGDVVTFELGHGKGRILATTKDPIVEHGVQQIRHLDHYCDALTRWLCGATAHGHFSIDLECYGVAVG